MRLTKIVPVVLVLIIVFQYADRVTEGNLLLRYQGETAGTLAGTKEKTLNVFTSNRINILIDDFKLWGDFPLFGVGVGASYYLKENTKGISAHVEMSRLISEHGLLGFIYFVILCVLGIRIFRRAPYVNYGTILVALFILAFVTTFHSAMRTFISPLLIGLSLLEISDQSEGNGEISYPSTQRAEL